MQQIMSLSKEKAVELCGLIDPIVVEVVFFAALVFLMKNST